MTHEEYLKHAWNLYYKGVDAEGKERKTYLEQARNVLYNVPSGYSNRDDLMKRITDML